MKVGYLSLAHYLCMDTVPKKVRCMEVIEKEREAEMEGVMEAAEGGGPSSQPDGWEGIFSLLKVRGQIYLFPWKLQ